MKTRSLLFISSSDFDAISAKGVVGMIAERSEGGYFDKVISVHPLATKSRTIQIDESHELVEFGFDSLLGGARWRLLRLAYAPLYVVRAVLGIRRLIRKNQIDIVRASDPYWAAAIGWLATRGLRTKFVISLHADWDHLDRLDPKHGAPKLFKSRRLAKSLERFLLPRAAFVLCIRRSLFDCALASGAQEATLRLIPHGVDLSAFNPNSTTRTKRNDGAEKTVCFIGRVSRENYIDDVFQVGRRLAEDGNGALDIVGDGPEIDRLRSEADLDPQMSHHLRFWGFVPRSEALRLRMQADVNLVPMGGFSLIEAAASGRPVVAYDTQWHSELIEDGVTGRLVAEGDVDGLHQAIKELLEDAQLAEKYGKTARERAFQRHDLKIVYERRADVYAEILGDCAE